MTVTALVLAGAGARGIIQAGMIKAFVDLGLEYDALYGSSVGSLNGAMLHAGQVDELIELWMNIRNKDVYTWAPWNMFIKNKGCLYDSTPLLKTIEKAVDFQKLSKKEKPFWVSLTNIAARNSQSSFRVRPTYNYLLTCDLGGPAQVLWASACPPVLMAPLPLPPKMNYCDDFTLTDGGLTNNYSISDAVHDGADRLIILAPMKPEPKLIRHIIDAIDTTVSIQLHNQLTRELRFVEKLNNIDGFRKIEVVLVQCDKPTNIGILDFDIKDKQYWINYGYEVGMKALTPIKKAVA